MPELPEVTAEELAALAKEAGFNPVRVPGLKQGVKLALAEKTTDSSDKNVIHLFYYFGNAGFSVFERETERADDKSSYKVLYNGRGKTRTLMWAAGGHEYVLVSHSLSKREMMAIEASVRDLFE